MNLQSDITTLKGVGEKSAALFHKLHIQTIRDLLFYFPRDYETFSEPVFISEISAGNIHTIRGTLTATPKVVHVKNLSILTAIVKDATGSIQMKFFNMPYLVNVLKPGHFYLFRGMVLAKGDISKGGSLFFMEQPRMYKEEEYQKLMSSIQPHYSLTKGLTSQTIGKAVKQILEHCEMPEEILPKKMIDHEKLMDFGLALQAIHFPNTNEELLNARKRLVFNEFFFFILMLRKSKTAVEQEMNQNPMIETAESTRFIEKLPYRLTGAQLKVIDEIKLDMTGESVMSRLIQGDVGSGKTIVAFWALLLCVSNGYQAAMMAPTEVLARQHYESLIELTKKYALPFRPVMLTGSQSASAKKEVYRALANGEANVVLGTHAVIQDKVEFRNLSLVITDEQHRFGVRQRENLKEKGNHPHVLVMSATPIPRTLAIILYGDLHISIIDELPAGRQPIKNCVVGPEYRSKAYEFIEKEVTVGRQVYCICPMVEEGELEGVENAVEYTLKLKASLPERIRITCLHGKMRPVEKNRIMEEFSLGEIDVLVSTTVIEVGINVPNATVIIVENAERFGLAQLHQLRGRVGRGNAQSYCIFINTSSKPEAKERLEILNHSNDGFYIAGEDLKLRGPGDLFGIRQSGALQFRLGDIYNDSTILKNASECIEKYKEDLDSDHVIQNYLDASREGLINSVDFSTI
ncbi:MAG TPA: ATP-dependent DNA helicase RecG [Lachnospiraceae bacterium]|nr:ATP-dependent DNA helicase RecG [Lachnospiraceae bacterium]